MVHIHSKKGRVAKSNSHVDKKKFEIQSHITMNISLKSWVAWEL
jgi:hypothetical protein